MQIQLDIFKRIINSRLLPFSLIILGLFFRFSNYLANQSLWLDEAWLAKDILTRTYKEIFLNLMTNNELPAIPPVGFMLIEKFFVSVLGNNEFALRLFPFLCGASAVIMFWILAKRLVSRGTAIMALTFFVFTEALIYYSAECKQYGGEVLTALLLYLAAFYFQSKPANLYRVLIFGIIGIIAMSISHTAILVLGAIALTQMIYFKNKSELKHSWGYLVSFLMWGGCFLTIYFIYLNPMFKVDSRMGKFVVQSTTAHFMPRPILSIETLHWLWWSFSEYFRSMVGLEPVLLAILLFIFGIHIKFKSDPRTTLLLCLPFLLIVIASGLRKFPFVGRFILFLLPVTFLFVAEGLGALMKKGKWFLGIGIIVYCIFIVPLIINAVQKVVTPRTHEEIRPLMAFLNEHREPGDRIYMNSSAQFAYTYYLNYFHFDQSIPIMGYFDDEIVKGAKPENNYVHYWFSTNTTIGNLFSRAEVQPLTPPLDLTNVSAYHQRSWILMSHITTEGSDKFIKECFDSRGKLLEKVERPGSWLYLYDLYQPIATIKEAKKIFRPGQIPGH